MFFYICILINKEQYTDFFFLFINKLFLFLALLLFNYGKHSGLGIVISQAGHNDRNGRKIDNILFKGKIDLKSINSTLRDKNKQYKKVVYLSRNDLLPSKLHKVNNKTHVCLTKFDESKCSNIYSSLVEILSMYTKNIVFVEPPPRATYIIENSECLFYDKSTANRFRKVINSKSVLGYYQLQLF